MTFKILINRCYGGFGLSLKARDILAERGFKSAIEHKKQVGDEYQAYNHYSNLDPSMGGTQFRMHPEVIRVVEELGLKEASGQDAKLEIKEFELEDAIDIWDHDGKEKLIVNGMEVW